MKRLVTLVVILVFTYTMQVAFAAERLCSPGDVDLSGVQEIDGRLVGEIVVPDGLMRGVLKIDCPLPASFTKEESKKLFVQYPLIDKQAMISALHSIGQTGCDDAIRVYGNDVETWATLVLDTSEPLHYYYWGMLQNCEASADAEYAVQYGQAKETVLAVINALGASACTNLLHAVRLDEEHFYPCTDSAYSIGPQMRQEATARFIQAEAEAGRPQRDQTVVRGLFEWNGLPMMDSFVFERDGEWYSGGSAFYASVNDAGELRYLQVRSLPRIIEEKAAVVPQRDWRELLSAMVANNWCSSNADREDFTYQESDGSDVTVYASYAVITGIEKCWVGTEKNTLVPGYYINLEEYMVSDDSLRFPGYMYGDAETLTCITY